MLTQKNMVLVLGTVLILSFGFFITDRTLAQSDCGDVNGDGGINVGDAVYIINHVFRNGPAPTCSPQLVNIPGELQCQSKFSFGEKDLSGVDGVMWSYDGESILHIEHGGAAFNCCPENIYATVDIVDNDIYFYEHETEGEFGFCHCLCLFNIKYRILNLPPGEYNITIYGLYIYGEDPLNFTVDCQLPSSSGSHYVERNIYPWVL
ncbi:MAG: hypothetical protein V3V99_03540 [candidate division Zixibacteria bacterium]